MSRYVPDYLDPHYDAWRDAVWDERNRLARDRCQCRHIDMPGTCPGPGPSHCPLVEQPEDEEVEE